MQLELNMGFDLKVKGAFHSNGYPVTIAKITKSDNSERFAQNVDILQEMVDLFNAKHAKSENA